MAQSTDWSQQGLRELTFEILGERSTTVLVAELDYINSTVKFLPKNLDDKSLSFFTPLRWSANECDHLNILQSAIFIHCLYYAFMDS